MIRRVFYCVMSVLLIALSNPIFAATSEKTSRVGILFVGGKDQPHLESFIQGMRELGYAEGKNIIFEYRYADGQQDRLSELAAELVRGKVDVIVTTSTLSALAARKVTRTVSIVMTTGNPIELGLAKSLAKPGGNVTGLSMLMSDLSGKRVELLKEALPKISRAAVLWSSRRASESVLGLKETEDAAKALSVPLYSMEVPNAEDINSGFAKLPKAKVNALIVLLSPMATLNSKKIVDLALKYRLPSVYPTRQFAEEGGLMAYGPLVGDLYHRAAAYVDKILKGAKPADLPVEQPTKFEFIVNLKTAKQIGLTMPPNMLARADQVIR
jgi:putative tryptophan/tyrosine transport system substrate-binding protein